MANVNFIEDAQGDLIDLEYFCSDFCARTSDLYNGWYGCVELYTYERCAFCDKELNYIDEEALDA